jgi:Ca2+-binding RTX toxin-like protein
MDTITVNGTQGDDAIGALGGASGATVHGLSSMVNINALEPANDRLVINALGGIDVVDAGRLGSDSIQLAINGGLGDDVLLGSQGNDVINGGDGDDVVLMGAGDDLFVWNPGDDNDLLEGQDGADQLLFNGANVAEVISLSANGSRLMFTRNVATVSIDADGVETVTFNAMGGADSILVNDLTGTAVTEVNLNLAAIGGGGDAQPDSVIVSGTNDDDTILAFGDSNGVSVVGLAAQVNVTGSEAATDGLTIHGLSGDDVIDASGLAAGAIRLSADGGLDNDVLIGSDGADVLSGGEGDDVLIGGLGIDVLDGGPGDDIEIQ